MTKALESGPPAPPKAMPKRILFQVAASALDDGVAERNVDGAQISVWSKGTTTHVRFSLKLMGHARKTVTKDLETADLYRRAGDIYDALLQTVRKDLL